MAYLKSTDYARGVGRTLVVVGDSLATTTNSTVGIGSALAALLPGWNVVTYAIGGQTWQQIASRRGSLPTMVTLSGNAFSGTSAISVTSISTQMLSTPSDNTARNMTGVVYGIVGGVLTAIPCTLARTASGGPPSTTETYTLTPALTSTATVPAGSVFYPDEGFNNTAHATFLMMGRNNTPDFTGLLSAYSDVADQMPAPRRLMVGGVVKSTAETTGTSNNTAITALNTQVAAQFPRSYVSVEAPTTAEMAAVSYTPSAGDLVEIANGVIPTGLRTASDPLHWDSPMQRIMALRIVAVMRATGWMR